MKFFFEKKHELMALSVFYRVVDLDLAVLFILKLMDAFFFVLRRRNAYLTGAELNLY